MGCKCVDSQFVEPTGESKVLNWLVFSMNCLQSGFWLEALRHLSRD